MKTSTNCSFTFLCFLLALICWPGLDIQAQQTPRLLPSDQPGFFINELPNPAKIDVTKGARLTMEMRQTTQNLGIYKANGQPVANTTVWGYGLAPRRGQATVTYPGPTFIAKEDKAVRIRWVNALPSHFLPVDYTMHMAHPHNLMTAAEVRAYYEAGNTPAVVHLHGGHTESASDGLPEAWYTQNFNDKGPQWVKEEYYYHNDQEAATLWYHDHALGITRLNVYAGLAGFYLLRDNNELNLINNGTLPGGDYEREIVIQDRMFTPDGQLFFPAYPGDPAYDDFITGEGAILPPEIFPGGGPTALAEFFGDFIIVNGKAWPRLEVEPRKYRLRLLNGSDSRFYVLQLSNGMSFTQIGTDDGLLPQPVTGLTRITMAPGERMDVILDFDGMNGQQIVLQNVGPDEPFDGFTLDEDLTRPTAKIMRFDVVEPLSNVPDASIAGGTTLRAPLESLNPVRTRKVALFEGMDEFGRLQPLLGVVNGDQEQGNGSLSWFEPITENPGLYEVEEWEVYNATGDAHPVHLHLVAFQIVNREPFDATDEGLVFSKPQIQHNGQYGSGFYLKETELATRLSGAPVPPAANEKGWKDTFIVPPGHVGRVRARFDRPGRYVWHCHILSHEDHEMMRPFYVGPMFSPLAQEETAVPAANVALEQNRPNPFADDTQIGFRLPETAHLTLHVFDMDGRRVRTLLNGEFPAGDHQVNWDGRSEGGSYLPAGTYFYQLQTGDELITKRLILIGQK